MIKPIGINNIIRLHHHSSTHLSTSELSYNSSKMLRLGEMEKLGLLANDCTDTLTELSIRSLRKHRGAYSKTKKMLENGILPTNLTITTPFAEILKSFGFTLKIDNREVK